MGLELNVDVTGNKLVIKRQPEVEKISPPQS